MTSQENALPKGFVYLKDISPNIVQDLKYATADNFTGAIVEGYNANKVIMTEIAAKKLDAIQQELEQTGLGLHIWDTYRPVRAVQFFQDWKHQPEDQLIKQKFYPNLSKEEIFSGGFIAKRSAHSRGSTVDLTITDKRKATRYWL